MTLVMKDKEEQCPICGSSDLRKTALGVVCRSCNYDWPYSEEDGVV
jgi:transposase-like protein